MNSNNNLLLWVPVLLSLLGALIGWYLSGLLGAVLAVAGLIMTHKQKADNSSNTVQLVLTWVFAIVAIIFFVIVLILNP